MRLGVVTLPVLLASCTTDKQEMHEPKEFVQYASTIMHDYASAAPEPETPVPSIFFSVRNLSLSLS